MKKISNGIYYAGVYTLYYTVGEERNSHNDIQIVERRRDNGSTYKIGDKIIFSIKKENDK